jgi:hypothetical protein
MKIILGLGHYSRTGKDTLADLLKAEIDRISDPHCVTIKRAFAYKLKELCHATYQWAGLREPDYYDTPEGTPLRTQPLPLLNWMTPVDVWVKFGNAIRDRVSPTTWIDYVLAHEASIADVLIISDVRYPNEALATRERGGLLIKVVRTGYGPKDTVADHALLGFTDWDYVAGPTMEALKRDAKYLAECIVSGEKPTQSEAMRAMILGEEKLGNYSTNAA